MDADFERHQDQLGSTDDENGGKEGGDQGRCRVIQSHNFSQNYGEDHIEGGIPSEVAKLERDQDGRGGRHSSFRTIIYIAVQ